MNSRSKVADEQTSSLGGWLFADLFLLIMVIGLAGFTIIPDKNAPKVVTGEAREAFGIVLLTGIVDSGDEDTTAYFRWGTNSGLSGDVQVTPAEESPVDADRTGVTMNATLEDLKPGTTYYFQAKAESKSGSDTGEIRSFKTAVPAEVPTDEVCSDGPTFIRTPFIGNYTAVTARKNLYEEMSQWVTEKGFVKPKVAVAIVLGWTNDPSGSDGQEHARAFFNTTMKDYAGEFLDVNTTLKAYQDDKLAESNFRIELYFVETANQCD
jgi:hypothetical protein